MRQNSRMKVIGITGGVGAGKSEILKYLKEKHRAAVIEADKVGHLLMEPGTVCYGEIVDEFGKGILREDLTIDRVILGKYVFSDTELLRILNRIIHPNVKRWILDKIAEEAAGGQTKLLVIEAALLLEERYDEICDEVWYIDADVETRIERLKKSRGYTDEKIAGIMANQKSREEFINACQVIIVNNADLSQTYEQIDRQLG